MTFLICVCLMALNGLAQAIIADGYGIFRVVVRVQDAANQKPVEGATVILEDAGRDQAAADEDFKAFLKLFDPTTTNVVGDALVYRCSGCSWTNGKKFVSVRGVLKVKKKGYADYSIPLSKLIGKTKAGHADGDYVPEVFVELTKAK